MRATDTKKSLIVRQSKDNTHEAQEKVVFEYLHSHVASASNGY